MKINSLGKSTHLLALVLIVGSTSSCTSMVKPEAAISTNKVTLEGSFLENKKGTSEAHISSLEAAKERDELGSFIRLSSPSVGNVNNVLEVDLTKYFNVEKTYKVTLNSLPLNEFLHYVLSDLLSVSYLIEPSIKSNSTPVTMELKEEVTARRLFQLVQNILQQNNATITLNDDVFYVVPIPKSGAKSDKAFGFGRTASDVPTVSGVITQLVPLHYKVSRGLRNTLANLVDARITLDADDGAVIIEGKREQVLRTLSLLEMLDSPMLYNKPAALLSFSYIDSSTFITKVSELLAQDGISTNFSSAKNAASVSFIPLEHLGKVVVFATSERILSRVQHWSSIIDKPATGSEQSYYIYHPKFARASDLGMSLMPLLKAQSSMSADNPGSFDTSNGQNVLPNTTQSGKNQNKSLSIKGDNINLVVDERANALIFYSSGKHYQELQPIIRQLDVLPKQVMMEVVIAEVKLTGVFAKGVEFALKNGASGDKTEDFSFSSKSGFKYSIVGLPGEFSFNLSQTDGLINVLSRPTLVVRDGVAATISVGDDIPTVGSTTTDPIGGDRQTTSIQYRKTGLVLSVTPTVNAQGTVIMTISQSNSSISSGSNSLETPAVFERAISTEVVAGDGQTVMLGGLISHSINRGATSVPVLGSIPVLGHLFRSDNEDTDKTELVVLVTPKIISQQSDWATIKESFAKGLENLKF
ncbi:secretin N-terminal domain-containing protein [Thalassotalea sediminis]|uniref:secretin N-terminal domain-containing protein n=1 Tax=Thalassotalea sediminis TaxID=1759089 RepID=UPI002572FFDF|nr:secretin N-terminal domain-containing protein [Thalassotalea sediminis]